MLFFGLSVFFVSSVQPMFMVSSLIMLVLIYSYVVYNVMGGYWFSYMLMMVMMSGVLVVFTYMVSLSPNESFENYNLVYVFIFMVFAVSEFSYIYGKNMSFLSLVLWNSYFGIFNLFMVSFLLSVMLIVVWLSCKNDGAMRVY
uniref:NADH dehydrogenase subunit 6 n=1 Tax=Selenops bursarius TaxID=881841 RepID=A0A0U1X9R4_9ARAC|nr:NADH dehydrogenase subunit 6 [Selenops bursarius]AIM52662.1 NADH dehydrogenase subunit 6 [Selenops bursarius]